MPKSPGTTIASVDPAGEAVYASAAPGNGRDRRTEVLDTAAELFATSGLRTSLKEIADACGILPGSLYHHFDSKEAIIVELISRYRADLDTLAASAVRRLEATSDEGIRDRIFELAEDLAACARRNRAALLLTFYEPPTAAGSDLVRAAQHTRTAIEQATTETFRRARATGYLRDGVDLDVLAHRFCGVMLHISLGVLRDVPGAQDMVAIRCRILMEGIASRQPSDEVLDRSEAMVAAREVVDSWQAAEADEDERFAMLRSVARREFGRRGYEATTVRDIASAAGISLGSVYRLIGSKDELLGTVMHSFVRTVRTSWAPVLAAEAGPLEKLDALMWVNINLVERFSDEFNIQLAWVRETPPRTSNLGATFGARLRDVQTLLAAGRRSGEVEVEGQTAGVRAWALFELLWVPEETVVQLGPREALGFARETVIRGASQRS